MPRVPKGSLSSPREGAGHDAAAPPVWHPRQGLRRQAGAGARRREGRRGRANRIATAAAAVAEPNSHA